MRIDRISDFSTSLKHMSNLRSRDSCAHFSSVLGSWLIKLFGISSVISRDSNISSLDMPSALPRCLISSRVSTESLGPGPPILTRSSSSSSSYMIIRGFVCSLKEESVWPPPPPSLGGKTKSDEWKETRRDGWSPPGGLSAGGSVSLD